MGWGVGSPDTADWYAIICDVRAFFATVSHDLLLALVELRVKDSRLLALIKEVVCSFCTNDRQGQGIPLGNVTSQIFANIVLHELDRHAKAWLRLRRYLRYNDDILVIVRGDEWAEKNGQVIKNKAKSMGFDLKVRTLALTKRTHFDWLGATHFFLGRTVRRSSAKRAILALKRGNRKVRRRLITGNAYRSMLISYRTHMKSYGSQI